MPYPGLIWQGMRTNAQRMVPNLAGSAFASGKTIQYFARKKPLGTVGVGVLLVILVLGGLAPWVAPFGPLETHYSAADDQRFVPPGWPFLLGTDNFGRDQFSRILWGARRTFAVALGASFLGVTVGAVVGLVSGYVGGKVSLAIERLLDAILAFPLLVLAIVMVAMLGRGTLNLIVVIAFVNLPIAARVQRATTVATKDLEYVHAAKAVGCSWPRILFRHIVPNTLSPYIVLLTAVFGLAVITEASLSFLGLGTKPPDPSWGLMLSVEGRKYFEQAWWLAVFPGLAITLAVFSFNVFGDALRDILDPRLKGE